ncbi:hypothetical protein F0U44_12215 [Nocardioides humilatus]|uniref:DUF4365 domain-containing protein n=1 Tax=Nocardioides humilatus TaxID=2607660 RepID=A0A5B1LHU3_9ACTN|nr:hypothetical protein [Nocardioides humilatus]KAA1419209.1 hypothetical protein F0U44_12215 [Nocardioides humilatus]
MSTAGASPLVPVHHSTSFELMVESAFLSDFLQEMWFGRGQLVDVLHSTVDAFGYDLVLQSADVTRHVQLKTKAKSGRTASFKISTQLQEQPAACVVLIEWSVNPAGRLDLDYRWFGNGPRETIPSLGDKVAKHTKANVEGVKGLRHGHRVVPRGKFVPLTGMSELATRLFGPA